MSTGLQGDNRTASVYAVQELVIDPVDHETVYASTWSGLFKSLNGAETWSEISPIVATEDAVPYSFVAVDPGNNQIVYTSIGDADPNEDGTGEVFAPWMAARPENCWTPASPAMRSFTESPSSRTPQWTTGPFW